jgi:endonuclease VIII-like 1
MLKEPGVSAYEKHAHLRFERRDGAAICFTDFRRFGSWQLTSDWGPANERGPDILTEFPLFLDNLAAHLTQSVFDKTICVLMLDQRFFNGVGNYLRAEILHRAGVHPFANGRNVIAAALQVHHASKPLASGTTDVLSMTRQVMRESLAHLQGFVRSLCSTCDQYPTPLVYTTHL